MKEKDKRQMILEAFRASEFKWRTASGLAKDTGLPVLAIESFLEQSPDVTRSKKFNSHGQLLYALKPGVTTAARSEHVFLFQSVPERYDLREKLIPGTRDTWYATRYRRDMCRGDIVFFWLAGEPNYRGIYGWGSLLGLPYQKSEWDSYGVDVQYEVSFREPILASSLVGDNVLREMLIFRAPQATNFLLSSDEANSLLRFLKDRGEELPAIGS
ncbi:EVE domain-containing protein [Caballeronia novacaledonica]|uniref:EVE domain-containing protein n=1 Tax=Caballeronia novacaledonica TaxID=1544861 RepID=A0AA37IFF0_9BURK|nr:EVE domain-containing protein [Caballeronia novacaledonica]GJH28795.1 hypothetical protein CBA19CS42_29785 [Caballeronia novacaledonica]